MAKDVRDFPFNPVNGDPYTARLADTPIETWSNTVLWKLAVETGSAKRGYGGVTLDPDALLDEALRLIRIGRMYEVGDL